MQLSPFCAVRSDFSVSFARNSVRNRVAAGRKTAKNIRRFWRTEDVCGIRLIAERQKEDPVMKNSVSFPAARFLRVSFAAARGISAVRSSYYVL